MFGIGQQARSFAAPQPDWVARRSARHFPTWPGNAARVMMPIDLAMLDHLDARLEHFQCMLVIIAARSGEDTSLVCHAVASLAGARLSSGCFAGRLLKALVRTITEIWRQGCRSN